MCYINTLLLQQKKVKVTNDAFVDFPETNITWQSGFNFPSWPIIIQEENSLKLQEAQWGFLPTTANTEEKITDFRKKFTTLNATSEKLWETNLYKSSAENYRCIIPSSGFIEWQHQQLPNTKKLKKTPYYIKPFTNNLFWMAGIFSKTVLQNSNTVFYTFSIITTEANPLMSQIHNTKKRMPTLFTEKQNEVWLSNNVPLEDLMQLSQFQINDSFMQSYMLSESFKTNQNPLEEVKQTPQTIQTSLF